MQKVGGKKLGQSIGSWIKFELIFSLANLELLNGKNVFGRHILQWKICKHFLV